MRREVTGRTSLARLQRRGNVVFDESCDAMRMSIALKMQSARLHASLLNGGIIRSPQKPQAETRAMGLLTPREQTVLALVVQGNTTKKIAATLGISFKTAASHRYSAMSKIGATNTAELVRDSLRLGIVPNGE